MKRYVSVLLLTLSLVAASFSGCTLTAPGLDEYTMYESGARFESGDYTGSGNGGELIVSIQLDSEGKISNIEVIHSDEAAPYDSAVTELMKKRIVGEQSLDVEVVIGATLESRAILEAVADAVSAAGLDPHAMGYIPASYPEQ